MSGGGMLGLAHVGALDVLESHGLLRCVKEYVGISAGSLVAFSICIGYTIAEMRNINNKFDFQLMQNLDPETMLSFMNSYGLDDGRNVDKFLGILLRMKGLSEEITFAEFTQQFPDRPQPRIYATNIETCLKKEFSTKETPNVSMKFAVLASSCVPFLFTPVRDLSGSVFVDGALVAFSPFHHLTDSERLETLGLTFDINEMFKQSQISDSILAYFKRLFLSAYLHHDTSMYEKWDHRVIYLNTNKSEPFNFMATSEEKEALFQAGRKSMEDFLKKGGRRSARRNSSP